MNNKQNLEKAQSILDMIDKATWLIHNYNVNRDHPFTGSYNILRYEAMIEVKARLKNYYNNTIDKLTKYNG